MQHTMGRSVVVSFSLILVILILFSAVTLWNITRLAESERWVAHTYEVLDALETTLSSLKDTQNGYRGYHATGDPSYAKPFDDAARDVPVLVERVAALTADNPVQQDRIPELRSVADKVIRYYGEGIRVRLEHGFGASEAYLQNGTGNAEVTRVRELVADMKVEEHRLLKVRLADSSGQYRTAVASTVLSGLIGLALTGGVFVLTSRDHRRRERTAQLLKAANDELENRVQDRTAALRGEIAERTRAEAELQTSSKKLQESNRELEQFATVASHDLQEPLRKIQAFSDRLREVCGPQLQGQGQEYLGRILSSAGRMRTLIDDLLSFSRVTRRGQPFVPTDLGQVAGEVMSDLEGRLRDVGGNVDVGPLPTVIADPTQMRQLLQNLIANALKFRKPEEPPVVTVRGEVVQPPEEAAGPVCRVTVADNGVGFEQVYAERIFQMFQRLHGRSQYEGNGIGLAICRKIVERHHGSIRVVSQPAVGTTFTIDLPVAQTGPDQSEG